LERAVIISDINSFAFFWDILTLSPVQHSVTIWDGLRERN